MLKKRLLSSVMASIMAVSAFSVVTSADATATTTEAPVEETKAVKTKAELKAYVDGFDAAYKAGIYKFGTYAGDRWNKALSVAEKVLTDEKALEGEISNAYYYLKAATDVLEMKTKDDLDGLIKTTKKAKESNNILNEEIGDLKWKPDKFDAFEDAYNKANASLSGSAEDITNAYFNLSSAYYGLEELPTVSKSKFAALNRQIENVKLIVDKYETWRRGSTKSTDKDITNLSTDKQITWGDILGTDSYVKQWSDYTVKGYNGYASTVTATYLSFADFEQVSVTSDATITEVYTEGTKLMDAINNFKPDSFDRSSASALEREIQDVYSELVERFAPEAILSKTDSAAVYAGKTAAEGFVTAPAADIFDKDGKLTEAGKKALKEHTGDVYYALKAGTTAETTTAIVTSKLVQITSTNKANYKVPAVAEIPAKAMLKVDANLIATEEAADYISAVAKAYKLKADILSGGVTYKAGSYVSDTIFNAGTDAFGADLASSGTPTDEGTAAIDGSAIEPTAASSIFEIKKDFKVGTTEYKKGTFVNFVAADVATVKTPAVAETPAVPLFDANGALTAKGKEYFTQENIYDVIDTELYTSTALYVRFADLTAKAAAKTNAIDGDAVKLFGTDGKLSADGAKYLADNGDNTYTVIVDNFTYDADGTTGTTAAVAMAKGEKITFAAVSGIGGVKGALTGLFDVKGDLTTEGKTKLQAKGGLKYKLLADLDVNLTDYHNNSKPTAVTKLKKGYTIDLADYVSYTDALDNMDNGDLKAALDMALDYISTYEAKGTAYPLSGKYAQIVSTKEGKPAEWAVVYRGLKYAFIDNSLPAAAGKSLAELQSLVTESYKADEVYSAHFSSLLAGVVAARKNAIDVIKSKVMDQAAYTELDNKYKAFKDELDKYKYSYGEIADLLYKAQKNIDSGEFAIPEGYEKAVNDLALAVISLIPSSGNDEVFAPDYDFIDYNRLRTTMTWWQESGEERNLTNAFEALKALDDKLEEAPEFAAGDVDGSGKVDTADALLILDYFTLDGKLAEGTVFHVEAADVNGDKVVGDSADALAALDIFTKA